MIYKISGNSQYKGLQKHFEKAKQIKNKIEWR